MEPFLAIEDVFTLVGGLGKVLVWTVVGTGLLGKVLMHNVETGSGVIVFLSRGAPAALFQMTKSNFFPLQCGSQRDNHTCQQDTFSSTPARVNYTLHAWGDYQQSSRFKFETENCYCNRHRFVPLYPCWEQRHFQKTVHWQVKIQRCALAASGGWQQGGSAPETSQAEICIVTDLNIHPSFSKSVCLPDKDEDKRDVCAQWWQRKL